jgi:epoxyqueuosine reductase
LPFSEAVRRSNYGDPPTSVTWLHSRFLGEKFNEKLRRFLLTELQDMGGTAVSPGLHQDYWTDYQHLTSNWSERHIAYAAGLGSFGLSRGLITEKGLAGRFGSVITDLQFPATNRSGDNPFQNCPFLTDQSCGVCIDRCPSGAITAQGKNKSACYQYTRVEDHLKALREKFGYEHSICGKCQVDVPCEDSIP